MKAIYLLVFLLFLGFPFIFLTNPAQAEYLYFQDEFNENRSPNTLESSKWIVYPNNILGFTTISEANGILSTTQQNNTNQYPLVVSKSQVLPAGDFSAEIKFQYTKVTHWGTGIALVEQLPKNGGGFNALLNIQVWQDKSVGPNMRVQFDGPIVYSTNINTNLHTLRVDRTGKKYLIFLDNQLIFTSPDTTEQVKYIWMGNPDKLNFLVPEWTTFNVDYIRVKSFAPEPFLELPWEYEKKGISFNEAALAISSYFDHEYPLLSTGLNEESDKSGNVIYFRGPPQTNKSYSSHDGYDYARLARANLKDPVLAAAAGEATYKNDCTACGNAILIDHKNGYQTRYYHLYDEGLITKTPGEKVNVAAGEQIGLIGATGNVLPEGDAGAHIHFMVVQDKDGDGDFNNNIPDGLVDPFGWQSKEDDPWEKYNFFYLNKSRIGNKSYYIWKKKLDNLDANLDSNGGIFETGRYKFNFPQGATNWDLRLEVSSAPISVFGNFSSIGSTIISTAKDSLGNLVQQFGALYELTVDFKGFDLSSYKKETISIYSSEDGINWNKEETAVDLEENIAKAQINHMTYFGLMAERIDNLAPATNVDLEGQMGDPNWFRSDVKVNLNPQDNEGGHGVDYTFYKLNEEDWKLYTAPLIFTNEGNYKIQYYSVDKDDNIEEVKTKEFNIDKTIPEAKVFVDPQVYDLKVIGIDQNLKTVEKDDLSYIISDFSGNQLKLEVEEKDKEKKDEFKINSMQYNNELVVEQPDNKLKVEYKSKDNKFHPKKQEFEMEKEVKMEIKYEMDKNSSEITTKVNGEKKIRQVKEGLVILQLVTNKGKLEYSYE